MKILFNNYRHHERSDVIQKNNDDWIASPSARNDD